MAHRRSAMIGSTVRTILGPALRECPQECGIVSMTEVEVSSDLSYVTVYVSALNEPDTAWKYLELRAKELRQELKSLGLARLPVLRFRIDPRGQQMSRLDELLS